MEKKVLSIETSCDETAVAIVSSHKKILSHQILSQQEHKEYGGVIPEIASRSHINYLDKFIVKAMSEANLTFDNLNGIAVTAGPGLIGGLIVGLMMAKAISHVTNKPLIAINHLVAHSLIVRMFHKVEFPFLLLIISGGHCQFLIAQDIAKYHKLGSSLDDSLGEAFDKVARMLGLEYPGGPIIEKKAIFGNKDKFLLPRPLIKRSGCDFSFSGLKTAVRNILNKETTPINEQTICDISASFQECIADVLVDRIKNAIQMARNINDKINNFVVTGGVAANDFLRRKIIDCSEQNKINIFFPPNELCTDNAVMVGWAGIEFLLKGQHHHNLNFSPKARWPLEEV